MLNLIMSNDFFKQEIGSVRIKNYYIQKQDYLDDFVFTTLAWFTIKNKVMIKNLFSQVPRYKSHNYINVAYRDCCPKKKRESAISFQHNKPSQVLLNPNLENRPLSLLLFEKYHGLLYRLFSTRLKLQAFLSFQIVFGPIQWSKVTERCIGL